MLETQGVTVITMGQDAFPSFYSRASSFASPIRIDAVDAVADVVRANRALDLQSGVLVAVPVPAAHEAQSERVEAAIQQALREASAARVSGRDITPFLLRRVAELTGGASLQTNIALIRNNARVGAQLARSLSCTPGVEVIGGLGEDVYFQSSGAFATHDSNPGRQWRTAGGVGRNVAVCIARLARAHNAPLAVALSSAVGDDASGKRLLDELRAEHVDTTGCVMLPHHATATCESSSFCVLCLRFFDGNMRRWCHVGVEWPTGRRSGGNGHLRPS